MRMCKSDGGQSSHGMATPSPIAASNAGRTSWRTQPLIVERLQLTLQFHHSKRGLWHSHPSFIQSLWHGLRTLKASPLQTTASTPTLLVAYAPLPGHNTATAYPLEFMVNAFYTHRASSVVSVASNVSNVAGFIYKRLRWFVLNLGIKSVRVVVFDHEVYLSRGVIATVHCREHSSRRGHPVSDERLARPSYG